MIDETKKAAGAKKKKKPPAIDQGILNEYNSWLRRVKDPTAAALLLLLVKVEYGASAELVAVPYAPMAFPAAGDASPVPGPGGAEAGPAAGPGVDMLDADFQKVSRKSIPNLKACRLSST